MKRVERYLLESCALTVLMMSLIYILAIISSPDIVPAVQIGRFFTILIFSFLTVGANRLFSIQRLGKPLAFAIHYVVLLLAFTFIFIDLSTLTGPKIFISIMIFTVFYALIFAIVIGTKKLCTRLDKSIKIAPEKSAEKEAYKPRYK